ncbi:MAG TPA: hypothetical protein VFV23_04845 [Verrucomicrobiae bacterium]|nr:hypothetical protein [Verrucomicrobiae bacterium]
MVSAALRISSFCAALLALNLHAKELSAYKIGDFADDDIVASVPLDVIDPIATAARRETEAQKTPTIFLSLPDAQVTNGIAKSFSIAFAKTHSTFAAAFAQEFPAGTTNAQAFSAWLAGFNRTSAFPVSDELANKWATGDAATEIENRYVADLLRMMHRPVRADELPAGFVLSDTFKLIFVNSANDKPTLADVAHGKAVAEMTSISRLQMLFRRSFTDGDQNLARALGAYFRPNCILDEDLTREARERDVSRLVAVTHFDAGQVIVHRGEKIGATAAAAIAALDEKLAPSRVQAQMDEKLKAQQEQLRQQQLAAKQFQAQAQSAEAQTKQIRELAKKNHAAALALQSQTLQERTNIYWLFASSAAVSAIALTFILLFVRRKPKMGLVLANTGDAMILPNAPEQFRLSSPQSLQKDLAPQLASAVKEAVVQELAAQRGELLKAQQSAAAELAEVVHRLDKLHAPLQERLKTYENRIEDLEKQLVSRTEENRELLKAKIDLTRRQLETERAGVGSDWSGAIN